MKPRMIASPGVRTGRQGTAVGVLLVAASALAAGTALAQSVGVPPSSGLTLDHAVELATGRGAAPLLASGRKAGIQGAARAAAERPNPLVELRREGLGGPLRYDDFATFSLPVDLFGRRRALRSALDASRQQATSDSIFTLIEVAYRTAEAWWMAWAEQSLAGIAEEQANLYRRTAAIDSIRAAEGDIALASAFRMQIEAQRASHDAAAAVASALRARAALAVLIGEDDPANVAVTTVNPDLEELPLLSDALAAASLNRTDLALARSAERAAERRRAAEGRAILPALSVTGGYKGISGYSTGILGISIMPPLFNANGGNRERASGEWLMATADRRMLELQVSNDVRAAYGAAVAIDSGTAGFNGEFVVRASLVAQAAEASYREGAASLVELLDSFRAAADARAALVRGTRDRALARLELRRAMGAPAVGRP